MKAGRDGFGDALLALGKNKQVVALTADLSPSVRMDAFKKKYPTRFFDVGVAEQNLIGVASGLSHVGKIPFTSSFGAFMPGMCYQQIRTTVAYNNNNVKLVATHCGIDVGEDGAMHQMLEDIALMRVLPNMTVVVPCDYNQAYKATLAMAKLKGPCYMRVGRSKTMEITSKRTPFKIGRAQTLRKGKKACIIASGPVLYDALKAADEVGNVRVINLHTIKPIDTRTILKAAKECKKIITIEDHQIAGGMGSAVSELVSGKCEVVRLGIDDEFGESGNSQELMKKFGLTKEHIKKAL
ncbi:transketolase family protein [Candidatus Woesearchaeota archaeon]|jgi:transketolase|nr:transketolase family protein [Candidatus Woesearchaeota archaeon]MBT4368537.1 transketolase family protein [Candidatus Woesearchaeota archaeon]MBT4713026.1 transketolase family protein [Candidatus Woesearchaeota archaeon]MBT6639938.1 transketolase family protein [Candidatus Woesearchaeota archaeon]MBT7134110.1 transketolase family protein [Candidatus Woesearchaeota archaeon]